VVIVHFLCSGMCTDTGHVQETVIGLVFVLGKDVETLTCTFISNNGKRTKLCKPVDLFSCIEDMVLH
jgi:hypothetical protein